MSDLNCIVVLGPTASGKTNLACRLADELNGEIISADSRQVYKFLNIGTGKDLHEYNINGKEIPYHLIDISEPGEQFYLHDFIYECESAFEEIRSRNKIPIICGGTGLYLDTLRKDFSFTQIKENDELRAELKGLSKEQLLERLRKFPKNITEHADLNSSKRIMRAIEVAMFLAEGPGKIIQKELPYKPYYLGINVPLEERKEIISARLLSRIENGLISEVKDLLDKGVTHERLQFFGLEYKFVSFYLQNKISKEELIQQLRTAIFQFAKRQSTWFRKMEKEGVKINWVSKDVNIIKLADNLKLAFRL